MFTDDILDRSHLIDIKSINFIDIIIYQIQMYISDKCLSSQVKNTVHKITSFKG